MATSENMFCELPPGHPREILFSVLQQENLITNNFSYRIEKTVVSRWVSSIYHIEANSSNSNLSLYLKCLPEDIKKRELMRCSLHFQNEETFYNIILPAFKQLQREKCLQESRSPISVPKCYAAEGNGKDDVVILEDMSTSGFVLLDRRSTMKLPYICLVLKELGRFHGFSLAFKTIQPEKMKQIIKCINEAVFVDPQFEEIFRIIFYNNLEDIYTAMKKYYEKESIYLKKFQQFLEKGLDLLPIQAQGDPSNEPYNVVTHGDLWINNFLFHYDEDTSEPDDICFLDFQQIRYCSPAIDLGRFLYVNMDKATRDEYRDRFLHCYHDSLSETLRQCSLIPENLLPFCELESQLRKHSACFITLSLLTIVHALDSHEEEEEYNGDGTESMLNSIRKTQHRMNADCLRRIFEVIEESVDRSYMDINGV